MKSLVILSCVLALAVGKYTDKYDDIDLNEILTNKRLLENYFKCMMDQGSCPPEGQVLRDNVEEAMATGCKECTDTQKTKAKEGITYIHDNEPEMFKQLTEKYDKTGEYTKKYFP
uniref:Chemosensory protein 14 n=1 Tax=Dendrolimus punctatus TaxID=238572 RepID=A0A2K8GL17_9NEOP|nr:Chemosensory protein 14 [Dendrolimus punctatus]